MGFVLESANPGGVCPAELTVQDRSKVEHRAFAITTSSRCGAVQVISGVLDQSSGLQT